MKKTETTALPPAVVPVPYHLCHQHYHQWYLCQPLFPLLVLFQPLLWLLILLFLALKTEDMEKPASLIKKR